MECPCCGYHDDEELLDERPVLGPRTQSSEMFHELAVGLLARQKSSIFKIASAGRIDSFGMTMSGPKIGDTIHIRKPEPFRAKMA